MVDDDGTPKVLKRPVHPKTLKRTLVRELQDSGKFPPTLVGQQLPAKDVELPHEPPSPRVSRTGLVRFEPLKSFQPVEGAQDSRKTANVRAKLRVLHERIPPLTGADIPPCGECKSAACCVAFVVGLSKAEYESGQYGDNAIKITGEMVQQLRGRLLRPSLLGGPSLVTEDTYYYLEGKVGQPCVFLAEDKTCSIYDIRPIVCRSYTCVNDSRITPAVRAGTEPILYSDEYAAQVKDA